MSMINDIQPHWTIVQPFLSIRDQEDYDRAIGQLNELIDVVGTDSDHPMYEYLDTLGTLIHVYEERRYPAPSVKGGDVLRYLMDEHGLRQSDLPEVGSQGIVSEILNGKRELNVRQIRELAIRFNVSPATFI